MPRPRGDASTWIISHLERPAQRNLPKELVEAATLDEHTEFDNNGLIVVR